MMKPEKRTQDKILKFLKCIPNLYCERRQAGGFAYKAGLPDLWFVYQGKHVEVEVKAEGGQPSGLQLSKEIIFLRTGSLYWRGCSFQDFTNFFQKNFQHLENETEES